MSRSLTTAPTVEGNRPSRCALPPGLDPGRLPAHVAVIMDGNGRWAGQRKLPRVMGHREGVEALKRTLRLCSDWGIGSDRKSTRLNSSHSQQSRMPSSA